ncbi:MAG: FAD-dependent oxidoreductase, partial [Verrucomicrobiales bacterium]|nr:FAD-dependent oxidoreductase [Verrucomicrobiales bacterium]
RAITPKADECSNLLVPVALSATHVAYSSIRVEPTWMMIGQSAGIAAALAAKDGVSVQELPYETLRQELLAQKQVLDLPVLPELPPAGPQSIDPAGLPGVILDDAKAELAGAWDSSANFKPYVGSGYLHDGKRGDGQSVATFRFKAPRSGGYELRMAYSPHETRAKKVPIKIQSGGLETVIIVDQTQSLQAGEAFRSVGKATLSAEGESVITIRNEGTEGFVIFDALQLIELKE